MPSFNPYGQKTWAMRNNAKPKRSIRVIIAMVRNAPDKRLRKALIGQYAAELSRSNPSFDKAAFIRKCTA